MKYSCRIKVLVSIIGNTVKNRSCFRNCKYSHYKDLPLSQRRWEGPLYHIRSCDELYKPGDRPLFERIKTSRKLGGYTANT